LLRLNKASFSHNKNIKKSGRLSTFDDYKSKKPQRSKSLAVIKP
jgi:hypothetical protein